MSTIRYFLPEDGDREDTPNVFLSPKPNRAGYPPLLGQIRGSFPLPGSYHFRFKTALVPGTDREKDAVAVWMDCIDDSEPVPVWKNSIFAKVTRICVDEEYVAALAAEPAAALAPTPSSGSTTSRTELHASPISSPVKPSVQKPTSHQTNSSDSLLGGFDDPPEAVLAASASGNLLDVDHHHPAPASGGSLLDMPSGSSANTPAVSGHDELLNMSAPILTQSAQSQHQQPMKGQYGYPQGQYRVQGMAQIPPTQQQQLNGSTNSNAFDKFSDPLNGLNWG